MRCELWLVLPTILPDSIESNATSVWLALMPNFMLPLIALGILASVVHLTLLSIVFEKLGLPLL